MKTIPLTRGKVAVVDDADYAWLVQYNWQAMRSPKGTGEVWYAKRGDGPRKTHKKILMHRQILNAGDGIKVDHRDHDGLNNQRFNLRRCTHTENMCNSRSFRTGLKGVAIANYGKGPHPWKARIVKDQKTINLGTFATPEEAAHAYDKAALTLFGEFALLNYPEKYP